MRYRRVLLVAEIGAGFSRALAAIRALAPAADHLAVLACPPAGADEGRAPGSVAAWDDELRAQAAGAAVEVEIGLVSELNAEALAAVAAASGIDLVVAGPAPGRAVAALSQLRRLHPVAVLWVGAGARSDGRVTRLLCVALGARAEVAVAAFLRDHGDGALRARVLSLARPSPAELSAALEISGVRASVEVVGPGGIWRALDDLAGARSDVELVVLARFPPLLLHSGRLPAPVLVLPPFAPSGAPIQRPLDVADVVDDGGSIRVRLGYAYAVGRNPPIADQEVAFVAAGRVAALVATRDGQADLPPGLGAESLGVFRTAGRAGADPLAAVERRVAVVRRGARPLVPFDVEVPERELQALAGAAPGVELLAVRLRPAWGCNLLRDRLRAAGLEPRVIDASAVLDEGGAEDVSDAFDAVRLARVAARLLASGFPVVAIVHRGPIPPEPRGFAALRSGDLAGRSWERPDATARAVSRRGPRLDAVTGARSIGGNRVEVELDNATARRWLLDAIALAERRVHLQTYMATDDAVGRQVGRALERAARRGLEVRVLVDSLHCLHGSFGRRNPLLERLAAVPGVELLASRPVEGVPSLEELKQRDHRKLVTVDGALALVGGRNLAHEYYTAFHEVKVTPATAWREVPWLDAGARVEGPAVAALERSFAGAWVKAGGAPFEIEEPPPAGSTPLRAVVHHGLRDAATLEAYLALVETARSHVHVVNGFPLLLELQHALVRALRRGVRVCALFGHVTPTHGGEPFAGEWTVARSAATALVHSRMDALVAAGGEAYQLALRDVPGWSPELGVVHPHVHAKALSVDGEICAIGSANLDVTASYWESELVLVVDDASVARALEAGVERVLASSVQVRRDDPDWQRLARRREWLRHWPGVLSV